MIQTIRYPHSCCTAQGVLSKLTAVTMALVTLLMMTRGFSPMLCGKINLGCGAFQATRLFQKMKEGRAVAFEKTILLIAPALIVGAFFKTYSPLILGGIYLAPFVSLIAQYALLKYRFDQARKREAKLDKNSPPLNCFTDKEKEVVATFPSKYNWLFSMRYKDDPVFENKYRTFQNLLKHKDDDRVKNELRRLSPEFLNEIQVYLDWEQAFPLL